VPRDQVAGPTVTRAVGQIDVETDLLQLGGKDATHGAHTVEIQGAAVDVDDAR
jgi:hypothetical protein